MAPKTLEATTTPETTSPDRGSDGQDTGTRVSAQFDEGEAEALDAEERGEILATPSKRNITPPVEPDVRAEGESADDAGEKPDGESPESEGVEPEGEESDEGDAEEREAKEQFDLALKMAGGDRRKALQILQTAMGAEAKEPAAEAKAPTFDAEAEAEQFYKDVAEKGEKAAFAAHLKRAAERESKSAEAIRRDLDIKQRAEKAAAKEVAALDALTKGAWRKDTGFMAWYQQPGYSSLSGTDAYTLYTAKRTARRGSENGATAAAQVVAAKKEKAAGAAASIPGGRPAGPNAPRPHVSAIELEMRESHRQDGQRIRALP